MKQVVQSYRTGELELADVPVPVVRKGFVLVRTACSLISAGTERMIIDLARKSIAGKALERPDLVRRVIEKARTEGVVQTARQVMTKLDSPVPLGYSAAGVVVEVGAGVSGLAPGDRVAVGGAGYANHAEYVSVPRNLAVPLPTALAFDAASFATVGAIALQGVRQAQPLLGESVMVVGLGLLGQITVGLLAANGCRVLGVDLDRARVDLALELGAEAAVVDDPLAAAYELSRGHGVDAVIITAAAKGDGLVRMAGEAARAKGRVVAVGMFGMDLPRDIYYAKELDFRMSMSYGPGRYDPGYEEQGHDYPLPHVRWTEGRNMGAVLDLLAGERLHVDRLITHRFPIDQALDAYALVRGERKEPHLGIVLEYPGASLPDLTVERAAVRLSPPKQCAVAGEVGVGFVGAGNFATAVLAPAFAQARGCRFTGIISGAGLTARHVGRKQGFAYAATEIERLLEDEETHAVVIATRHDLHADQVVRCLEAGKQVFVEKPLALDEEGLSRIERASAVSGNAVMVGFNRCFSPMAVAAREHLAGVGGPLVMLCRINAGSVPDSSWVQDPDEGGGRIVGETCHWIALMRSWCEADPVEVHAHGVKPAGGWRADDNITLTIRFADGSVGTLVYFACGHRAMSKEHIEASRGGRSAVIDNWTRAVCFGSTTKTVRAMSQDKGYPQEAQAFVDACRSGAPLPFPLAAAAAVTRATFAARERLGTGEKREY